MKGSIEWLHIPDVLKEKYPNEAEMFSVLSEVSFIKLEVNTNQELLTSIKIVCYEMDNTIIGDFVTIWKDLGDDINGTEENIHGVISYTQPSEEPMPAMVLGGILPLFHQLIKVDDNLVGIEMVFEARFVDFMDIND